MHLLLLSNSSHFGQEFFSYARKPVLEFLSPTAKRIAFIPYAAVRFSYDDYAALVGKQLAPAGHHLVSVHEVERPSELVESADIVMVGGGNTFQLLHQLYQNELIEVIRRQVREGKPYVGWSAGSNVACPTICTTNDMPIVEPRSFRSFDLVPFQINPHFTDARIPDHNGESRTERLLEYVRLNPSVRVIGLPEGTSLLLDGSDLHFSGSRPAKIFYGPDEPYFLNPGESVQFLLQQTPAFPPIDS